MASVLFVALQCCECSTMQVKQKKKSSNKWICVICNQKQSVKKVFAQGYKAKELRFFVQSFNMSRKVADEEELAIVDTFSEVDVGGETEEEVRGKKRSDWSEYLDSDLPNDDRRLTEEEEEEDVKIVTEMPKDMFKRPKLNKYSNADESSSSSSSLSSVTRGEKKDGNNLFTLSSSRGSIKKPEIHTNVVMMMEKVTDQRDLMSERVTKPASKWDAYLDEGEQQGPSRVCGRDALKDDDVGAIMEISSEYQIVDDEVHPDFM